MSKIRPKLFTIHYSLFTQKIRLRVRRLAALVGNTETEVFAVLTDIKFRFGDRLIGVCHTDTAEADAVVDLDLGGGGALDVHLAVLVPKLVYLGPAGGVEVAFHQPVGDIFVCKGICLYTYPTAETVVLRVIDGATVVIVVGGNAINALARP